MHRVSKSGSGESEIDKSESLVPQEKVLSVYLCREMDTVLRSGSGESEIE
jgi:hypothetical protein